MRILIALSIVFLSISIYSNSQCDTLRYKKTIFTEVYKHSDVTYGEAPRWNWPYLSTSLEMDIYEPLGDFQTKRPLMIWLHGGAFLFGDKTNADMVAFCDSFARKGYVTASLEYRLGFNVLSGSSAERAVYRSVQDLNAGLRFLFKHASIYGIDTNYVFIGGSSAGGFTVLHTVYMNQSEAPESITESPDMGCISCEGNEYSHNPKITGYVSLWGAIGDSSWISSDETTPGLLVHGTDDGVVYYGAGSPFGYPILPEAHGTRCISNQLDSIQVSHKTIIEEGLGHVFYQNSNSEFNNYWDTVYQAIQNHYVKLVIPNSTAIISGEDSVCKNQTYSYNISNTNNNTVCWNVVGGEIKNVNDSSVLILWNETGIGTISFQLKNSIAGISSAKKILVKVFDEVSISESSFSQTDSLFQFSQVQTGGEFTLWDFGDGNYSTENNPTHIYQNSGDYKVTLIVSNDGKCSDTNTLNINFVSNSIDENTFSDLKIFPNPSKGNFNIEGIKGVFDVMIYDIYGKLIFKELNTISNNFRINQSVGYYQLKLIKENTEITIPLIIH